MVHQQEKVEEFLENGFLHMRSWLDPIDCQRLICRMKELTNKYCHGDTSKVFEAGEDRQSKDDFFLASAAKISFFFDKNAQPKNQENHFQSLNKVGHALHDLCPVFRKFSHQQRFYDLMTLLGQQKPELVQSMFIFKQSHFGDEVPPHQDASFLYTEPNSVIGLWVALEDADEENGCLWVLAGGHRGPLKNRFLRSGQKLYFGCEKRVNWPRKNFRPIVAKAGDLVILHGLLPHLSEKNHSSRTRFAYTLHFIDRKSHYEKSNWLDISRNDSVFR